MVYHLYSRNVNQCKQAGHKTFGICVGIYVDHIGLRHLEDLQYLVYVSSVWKRSVCYPLLYGSALYSATFIE